MVINIKNTVNMKNIKILGRSMTNKNKNKKGFTLIELLVVVAIIGALAAVGVVAYNGYIGAARENSTKSIHNSVVKYIANERGKCALDESNTIMGTLSCTSTAAQIITALTTAATTPLSDKDPYDGDLAVVGTAPEAGKLRGNVVLTDASTADDEIISISTTWDKAETETLTSTVTVSE